MSWLLIGVVSLASGLLGSLGMGAGTVLLLYLRVYGGYDQFAAQGINLIFFLPIAVLSLDNSQNLRIGIGLHRIMHRIVIVS